MMVLTRPQRESIKKLYERYLRSDGADDFRMSYREFRKHAQPLIGGSGCIMVPWCGMWVGIELDGHTHT